MSNAKLLLSFDIEEFDLPEEFGVTVSETAKYDIAAEGTAALLALMAKQHIRATFFTTAAFAEHFPELIRQMAADGHEVASHGMNHTTFAVNHLRESKERLEELANQCITGFRMPRLAAVAKTDILAAGYTYESSLNPVWLPGRYCNLTAPLLPYKEDCGLWQFPISALPLARFPLFWLSFKNLPLPLYKMLAGIAAKTTGYYNMYSHPWEYSAQAADKQWQIPAYIVRHAGDTQLLRLDALIRYMKSKGEFITFDSYFSTDITKQ